MQSGEALAAVQPAAGTVFLVLSFPGIRGDTHQFKLNGLVRSTMVGELRSGQCLAYCIPSADHLQMDATAQVLWQ